MEGETSEVSTHIQYPDEEGGALFNMVARSSHDQRVYFLLTCLVSMEGVSSYIFGFTDTYILMLHVNKWRVCEHRIPK